VLRTSPTLFTAGEFRATELDARDIPILQGFFDANPKYFLAVNGQPAMATEARDEFQNMFPEGWSFTKQWIIGFWREQDSLIGMANVVSDLLAPGVWHIGLFVVATSLHGSGAAQSIFAKLEDWARGSGAQWLRMGVVEGNTQAERFWKKFSLVEVRKRDGVEMGRLTNTIRVMAKPLAGGALHEYLALVARDRPDS
jgi:RimJ/RimL family protein N-acetyltransferase